MTLQHIIRPLNTSEQRILRNSLSREEGRLKAASRRIVVFGVTVFGVFWGLTVLADKRSLLPATIFWLLVLPPLLWWAYLSARRDIRSSIHRLQSAFLKNEVRELRVEAKELVEFAELEDEGACYAFQVESDKVLFIVGQDYYSSARFPNTDFSLNQIVNQEGKVIEEVITKRGTKLSPKRTIASAIKSKLWVPENLQVIEGHVDDLELLLQGDHGVSSPH